MKAWKRDMVDLLNDSPTDATLPEVRLSRFSAWGWLKADGKDFIILIMIISLKARKRVNYFTWAESIPDCSAWLKHANPTQIISAYFQS